MGSGTVEFQPDLFARHNLSFFVGGAVSDRSAYSVTAGIRLYFGPDKPLIRRHREDDPPSLADTEAQYAEMWTQDVMIHGYSSHETPF
jgi:hypothetical protein